MEKARITIDMCVTPSVGAHILHIDNSQEAWEKLQQIYEGDGAARRINLLWNFIRTKLEDCKNTDDYVTKKITWAEKLKDIGLGVPDKWLALLLSVGIPKKYEPAVMALENVHEKLKSDQVISKVVKRVVYHQDTHDHHQNGEPTGYFVRSSSNYSNARGRQRNWRGNTRGRKFDVGNIKTVINATIVLVENMMPQYGHHEFRFCVATVGANM